MYYQSAGKVEMSRFHGQLWLKNGMEGNEHVLTGNKPAKRITNLIASVTQLQAKNATAVNGQGES